MSKTSQSLKKFFISGYEKVQHENDKPPFFYYSREHGGAFRLRGFSSDFHRR